MPLIASRAGGSATSFGGLGASLVAPAAPIVPEQFESIASNTWTGGTYAPIVFSSIPQTFKHLQVRFILRDVGGVGFTNGGIAFNSSSGVNTRAHISSGNGSSVTTSASSADSYFNVGILAAMSDQAAGTFAVGILDILDYTDTNKYKTIRGIAGGDGNGSGKAQITSGLTSSSTAISSITFYTPSNGWANDTQFALYGIKG